MDAKFTYTVGNTESGEVVEAGMGRTAAYKLAKSDPTYKVFKVPAPAPAAEEEVDLDSPTPAEETPDLDSELTGDELVLSLRRNGATWKAIALTMGYGWNGANMDGGRAKRAYNRALKAEAAANEPQPEKISDNVAA